MIVVAAFLNRVLKKPRNFLNHSLIVLSFEDLLNIRNKNSAKLAKLAQGFPHTKQLKCFSTVLYALESTALE